MTILLLIYNTIVTGVLSLFQFYVKEEQFNLTSLHNDSARLLLSYPIYTFIVENNCIHCAYGLCHTG